MRWKLKKNTLILVVVLLVGLYFRCGVGLYWDRSELLHPDERFLTMVAEKVQIPGSLRQYLNSNENPLSPYIQGYNYYVYGTLPLTLTKFAGVLVGMTGYGEINIVGRVLSSLIDILCIYTVYLLGAALYSRATGIIGAVFLALSVQNIQLSHFMGTENFVGAFVTLCALFLVYAGKAYGEGHFLKARGWLLTSGLMIGLGLACKVSAAFFLPIVALAACGALYYEVEGNLQMERLRKVFPEITIGAGLLFALTTYIGFRFGQPNAFEGSSLFQPSAIFLDNMHKIKEVTDGGEWPPNVQWAGRTPILFTIQQMLWWEMGVGFFIAAAGGALWGLYELIFKKRWAHFIPVAWSLFFLLYQSTRFVKYGRYLSIVYPFFALLAGYFVVHVLWNTARSHSKFLSRIIPVGLIAASLFWAIAFTNIYRHEHTRFRASRWIFENVPLGSKIGNESWDDGLPMRIDGKDGFGGMYTEVSFNHYEPDTQRKLDELIGKLSQTDYLVLSSNRAYASISRIPKRFPFTSHYYKMLFNGELGFELVHTETQYPSFLGLTINTDRAVESFTVYDHPKVLIFKKTPRFDPAQVRATLNHFPEGEFGKITTIETREVEWIY